MPALTLLALLFLAPRVLPSRCCRAVVTVAVVLEPAMGGLVLKSGLRIAGTTLAGFLGVG